MFSTSSICMILERMGQELLTRSAQECLGLTSQKCSDYFSFIEDKCMQYNLFDLKEKPDDFKLCDPGSQQGFITSCEICTESGGMM